MAATGRVDDSRWLVAYVAAVDLLGAVTIAATWRTFPVDDALALIPFIVVAAFAEATTIPLSKRGGISFCFIVNYLAAVLYGPCFGALTAAGGSAFADGLVRGKSFLRTAFNMGQLAIVGGLTGIVYHALAADSGFGLTANGLAYIAAGAVYILVNSGLVGGVIALHDHRFLRQWLRALKEGGVFYIAMAPLAALMAHAYEESPWTLLYFPLLIWVIYRGFWLYTRLRTETDTAMTTLANMIDKRDRHTYQHSIRVASYAGDTGERLGLPADLVDEIVAAAHVHDLGKISIDNRILLKEGLLSDDERRQVKTHAEAGAQLAGQFSLCEARARIVRHHHERWDGTGYPDGLSGEAIPIGARIIAVADVYDAMTSDRPYRDALPHEVAVAELIKGSGTQFDPRVVDAFLNLGSDRLRDRGGEGEAPEASAETAVVRAGA